MNFKYTPVIPGTAGATTEEIDFKQDQFFKVDKHYSNLSIRVFISIISGIVLGFRLYLLYSEDTCEDLIHEDYPLLFPRGQLIEFNNFTELTQFLGTTIASLEAEEVIACIKSTIRGKKGTDPEGVCNRCPNQLECASNEHFRPAHQP